MTAEIRAWLSNLDKLQKIWKEIAPGFLEGDLKKFGHQRFSDLLPAADFSAEQIAFVMETIGAHCQRDRIGIPTQASLQDLSQTTISFINRISSVHIFAALIRLFRNFGVKADPSFDRFGESSVAGMIVGEVLGEARFDDNRLKQDLHEFLVGNFGDAGYLVSAADLRTNLDSTMTIVEVAKSIID